MDVSAILPYIAFATSVVSLSGVVIWGVRQEGRINAHDQLFVEREKRDNERHQDYKDRLVRIETKLDAIRKSS